jgi:hypothetical protein
VGDGHEEDWVGSRAAGFQAAWLQRAGGADEGIAGLNGILGILGNAD